LPRASSSCLPSRVQQKSKIKPDVKLVIWRGAPPDNGCSQMLEARLGQAILNCLPEGDQCR
jgi:hypothetical protein